MFTQQNWKDMGVILSPSEEFEVCENPIEKGRIQCFTCNAIPLNDNQWRIWYSAGPGNSYERYTIAYAEGIPRENMKKHEAVLCECEASDAPLAIGNLPAGWRPFQPICIEIPDGSFMLYFWAHGPGVVRFLCAKSDDGRRFNVINPYKPCLYHPNDRAVDVKFSGTAELTSVAKNSFRPDFEPAAPSDMICNDATNVYLLSDGSFEMYIVRLLSIHEDDKAYIPHDNLKGMIRVIERRSSKNGIDWSAGEVVLAPDENDFADLQFYHLAVTHTDQGRIGMLGHYRVKAQTMDIEFCFSQDGINWNRPFRKPGFPREKELYGVYPASSLVKHNNEYWLFYTGTNTLHNEKESNGSIETDIRLAITESPTFMLSREERR